VKPLRIPFLRILRIGSSFKGETADELDTVFFNASFPTRDKIILNRTYAGYRGCLTLVEEMYYNY
jgi:nitrogenase molybdenum-iron protein beta chain